MKVATIKIKIDEYIIRRANVRLKEQGEWEGTDEEWSSYIERLIMENLGNL